MKISRSSPPLRALRRSGRAPVAVAVAAVVATLAIGSADARGAATPDGVAVATRIACPGLPRGLALTGNGPHGVWRVTSSGSTFVAGVRSGVITKAVRGRDSTIWVEARRADRPNGRWRRIVRINPDGARRNSETGDVRLSHVGTVGPLGRATVATYIDRDRRSNSDPDSFGSVYVEFSGGERRSLGNAGGPENLTVSAAPAVRRVVGGTLEGVVALGRYVDLTEDFSYQRLRGGTARGLFDPTDAAPYAEPPLFSWPILSPYGAKLAWTEGPDFSTPHNRFIGNWKLVIANSRTGTELLRLRVGGNGEELHQADYDGRYWVGTFGPRTDRAPKPSELRVRVVDTWAATPQVHGAGCTTGFIASIDRFAQA